MPPKLPTESRQQAPGVTSEQPASGVQQMPSARKRKDSETTPGVPVKKDTPRPGEQKAKKDDEPKPSQKKAKTGDQSQN